MIQAVLDFLGNLSGYKQMYDAVEGQIRELRDDNESLKRTLQLSEADNQELEKYMPERWMPKAQHIGKLTREQIINACPGDFELLDYEHVDISERSWQTFWTNMIKIRPRYIADLRDCENFTVLVWSMANRYCPGVAVGFASLKIPNASGLLVPHWANPVVHDGELWFLDLVMNLSEGLFKLPDDWRLGKYAL